MNIRIKSEHKRLAPCKGNMIQVFCYNKYNYFLTSMRILVSDLFNSDMFLNHNVTKVNKYV